MSADTQNINTFNAQARPALLSPEGLLANLTYAKRSLLLGEVLGLLMVSKVHRLHQVRDVADILLPALNLNQFRIYRNAAGEPVALVTWAKFSAAVEAEYLGGKAVLSEAELQSGDIIYMTDFIAPYGHSKMVIRDLQTVVFPEQEVRAWRFTEQGKTRPRLWKFYGARHAKACS